MILSVYAVVARIPRSCYNLEMLVFFIRCVALSPRVDVRQESGLLFF